MGTTRGVRSDSSREPGQPESGSPEGGEAAFERYVGELYRREDAESICRARNYLKGLSCAAFGDHLRAAQLLLGLHVEPAVVSAAFLRAARKECDISHREIADRFGADAAGLVERTSASLALRTDTEQHRREDVASLLRALSGDLRDIVLRLGLRLAKLERFREAAPGSRTLARETLELYVPLAGRLGMRLLRQKLEDQSFRLLEPEAYHCIARDMAPLEKEDVTCLELLRSGVERLLVHDGVEARVEARVKGLYSIYRKMRMRQLRLHAVMDKLGLRIIVPSVRDCYMALGKLHTHFRPIPKMFTDYIGLPKENGYQSLHTCVYPIEDITMKPVEFQIRTELMHIEAEYGVAAHWKYKAQDDARKERERHLRWLRSLPGKHEASHTHQDFVEVLRRQVFEDHLVVFVNRGRKLRLPFDSTVHDLLALAGEDRLEKSGCQRVKINGVWCGLDDRLQDGDSVDLDLLETGANLRSSGQPADDQAPRENKCLTSGAESRKERPAEKKQSVG